MKAAPLLAGDAADADPTTSATNVIWRVPPTFTKSSCAFPGSPRQLDAGGHSVVAAAPLTAPRIGHHVMDIIAIVLAVATFAPLLGTIELLDRV